MKRIIDLLNNHPMVDEWKIISNKISSTELFFIKEKLQMNRAKDVEKHQITVYKNFEIDGKKFKGSSSANLSSVYTDKEVMDIIDKAALAASFVKNQYYDLVKPTDEVAKCLDSKFKEGNPIDYISKLVKDIYEEDNQYGAFINSSEFFIDIKNVRIINSNGLDVSYQSYKGEIELITEAKGELENIELFEIVNFNDYDKESLKNTIKERLFYTSLRAKAVPMPNVKDVPVILRGTASKELWGYYLSQANAESKYSNIHNNNVGDYIQAKDSEGDMVTITMKPVIGNSIMDRYYDIDGLFLKDTVILENGILKNMYASKRYADYFNIKPTGNLNNICVNGGKYSEEELKKDKYLEVIAFSAFQADILTGTFGGEFRLAIYFDGDKEIPVTLGSVTGNIIDAQKDMYLSKELVKENDFFGPKIIKFNKMTIAGN